MSSSRINTVASEGHTKRNKVSLFDSTSSVGFVSSVGIVFGVKCVLLNPIRFEFNFARVTIGVME